MHALYVGSRNELKHNSSVDEYYKTTNNIVHFEICFNSNKGSLSRSFMIVSILFNYVDNLANC